MNRAREGRQQSKETVTFPTEALRLGTRCSASRTAPPKPTPRAHHRWKSRQASPTGQICVPSHSPSDIVSSHSKLRWALVRFWPCRKIHLYGESKKSTHGHQTHLPARTHRSQMAKSTHARTRRRPEISDFRRLQPAQARICSGCTPEGACKPTAAARLAADCIFFFFPLIVPPTWVYPGARCGGLECTCARADKFICMAKRKNRLTATKLISRRARTSGRWRPACLRGHTSQPRMAEKV